MAPHRAMKPPTVCTTVEPAKSRNHRPSLVMPENQPMVVPSQPPGPHSQCPMIG
jgi:hypothetical protein